MPPGDANLDGKDNDNNGHCNRTFLEALKKFRALYEIVILQSGVDLSTIDFIACRGQTLV